MSHSKTDNERLHVQHCFCYHQPTPITNKDVPICFFITSREIATVLVKWLNWVKENTNVNSQRIMIDCSTAEIETLRQPFSGQVGILLCHWRIKRTQEKHLKTDVKVIGDTHESVRARDSIRITIHRMMHAESIEA
ncbi:hypothetical protein BCV72DRAFT_304480 [Rhizopus microsporus var. microsporus]|uniref:MULE transposase domain-containing protein n=2 Tax=Rhizopus microsporus TaxID=58291 RepID=A0A2G4SUR6_RHIZD|nr:uncharacterized protein RHIMIDRAFT_237420 [Rhizopus microsporus ATCC 52813]ORE07610.1 hypothetical protein BCV72DRAFT_304480 [Rhizopus microsporus var. microsporus]PHZ12494.1 hypothetical protein RHIMIDRAFT_237420 [Rhizopus microsporus ATCC 52813]